MTGVSFRPGLEEYARTTGAVLGGRDGWEAFPAHHPENAGPAEGVTCLNRDAAGTVRIALTAAGGTNVEVFSPTVGSNLSTAMTAPPR